MTKNKTWNILRPPEDVVLKLSEDLSISPITATIMANRGIRTLYEADSFLNPSLDHLHPPSLMKGMSDAVEVLCRAVRDGRNILVCGDYDVDGVTGTTLLVSFLRHFTDRVSYCIPHRVEEGYGLQSRRIRRFASEGGGLVLTVDCGISNRDEVREGKDLGLSFIVTDHHKPPSLLPPADAIINPRQAGCEYPFKDLAGVGIAFKLVQGAWEALRDDMADGTLSSLAHPFTYLDLVALGTVADIVPLRDENRILVKHGLEALDRTGRAGLKSLKEISGLHSRTLRSHHIGFVLGPRINAVGRLDSAEVAVDLLLEKKPLRAQELALVLNAANRERREIEFHILRDSLDMIHEHPGVLNDNILVLSSPEWHPGVIGIVASRLAERFSKPTILISTSDNPGRGSARSIPNYDLYSNLNDCRHLLETFGGHSYAAGLSIDHENIDLLRKEINVLSADSMGESDLNPSLDIDSSIDFDQLRPPLLDELRRLLPFGSANPSPVFMTERVSLSRPPRSVGNNRLLLSLSKKPFTRKATGYNMGELADSLSLDLPINVAYSLDLEALFRRGTQELRLCDISFPYSLSPPL